MHDPLLKQTFSESPDCPKLEALAYALDLPPDDYDRRRAEHHLRACARCRANLQLARAFEDATPRPEEREAVEWIVSQLKSPISGAPKQKRAISEWWRKTISARLLVPAFVAATVLVVTIGFTVRHNTKITEPINADITDTRVRAGGVALTKPIGDVSRTPSEFCWNPVPGSAAYDVVVTEVDRKIVYSGHATGACISVPRAVEEILVPRKTLLWHVTAVDRSGAILARSGTEAFRLSVNQRNSGEAQ